MPLRNPCALLPRRLQVVASLTLAVLLFILLLGSHPTSTSSTDYIHRVPYGPAIQSSAHQLVENLPQIPHDLPHVNTPAWLNPFRGPAHTPPPEQANSSSGEARWYTDFKWRNPFSSDTTLDEERAVLPPLAERARVYTYFESTSKDDKTKKIELELLQVWRRAWWAQGFKPIVLGKPEAMNNPLYRAVQGLELEDAMEKEMMRWLAWGNMGTGILSNWLAVPMAAKDDTLLEFLRRGEFPSLTWYKGLESGMFVGSRGEIEKAVKEAIAFPAINTTKSMFEAVGKETFAVEADHGAIAFYSSATITAKYPLLATKLSSPSTAVQGLALLPQLINSHLHTTWQNTFSSGIAVLKPLPAHTTTLIQPALDIARNLSQCPSTPIPASCPPNKPRCKPCVSNNMLISVPPVLRNTSSLFTIATVPHPYTLTSLLHSRLDLGVKFVRRETDRDSWTVAATKELLGTGLSSFSRLPALKDFVAGSYGEARTLWLVAEEPVRGDSELDLDALDWHFGFQLPRSPVSDGKSVTPVPGPERRPPPPKEEFGEGPPLSEQELMTERSMFMQAQMILRDSATGSAKGKTRGGSKSFAQTREVVEAWNLADTEVWRFVRAWDARRQLERRGWEEEEEGFLGKGTFGRWIDKIT
ncbi:hypothetical protein LTR56_022349 [Elasticomyces elasticus]|nr:hypothetical protein LTR56_022349 [Elasticomyces elasticus]KAK3628997.1 hypothetical protein LTR22_022073 [Elasticomyces elasticus]KAK4908534.1 hypothetical protein LTR49_022557 [Elasticomyces elasticus]KAK5734286.1 hypothetical protein LTS12_026737 [Elasticomyces elasticus]